MESIVSMLEYEGVLGSLSKSLHGSAAHSLSTKP